MKYILSLIIISLCLFVANVAATPSLAEKVAKEHGGKVEGGAVDSIDTAGISYRYFGMKNRRGDSAGCKIQYKSKSRISIETEFDKGETKRRDIFERDTTFEKVINKTQQNRRFADYNSVKMSDCWLSTKGSVESDAVVDSDEESSASFAPDKKASLKEERKKVGEENAQNTDIVESSDNSTESNLPVTVSRERIIVCVVLVLLVAIIIILNIQKRKLQKQMINNDNYSFDEYAKLKERIEEKIIENNTLRIENQRLHDENERLKQGYMPIAAVAREMPPPVAQTIVTSQPLPTPQVVKSTFYFSNPIGNSFNALKSTPDFEESKSLYRFERVGEDSNADIFVVENEPRVVQRFVQSSEIQMGVCEFEGGYKKDATSIETVEPGSAVLDDGKWTVKKKIKIRYC